MKKKTLHLVFQTHWDREWYQTFETYRLRLIYLIRRVIKALEENEIQSFVLDGQTLPLYDFLDVAEDAEKEKVYQYIKEERLIIGPWYVAMDEFLVQGESIIRNLEIGDKSAKLFGKNQTFGYLPDTFGHIGQMPQILKNFGMEDAMMWRGIDIEESEFIWEGIDGSKLFTIYLSEGYYQPILNHDQFLNDIKTYVEKISKKSLTSNLLLTAGGDHLLPTRDNLKLRIEKLREAYPDYDFKENHFLGYVKDIKQDVTLNDLVVLKGELNSNAKSYILPNVWSTRSYLKITNQLLEDQLIKYIEPMSAYVYLNQENAPMTYIEHIWKKVLENHPHDSICGCSIDEVHQENEMRSKVAIQMVDALKKSILNDGNFRSLEYYQKEMPSIESDDLSFSIFNPHPFLYSGYITAELYLHLHNLKSSFLVETSDNRIFNVAVESESDSRLFESPLDYPPFFKHGKKYKVHIEVKDLKPLSWTNCKIKETDCIKEIRNEQNISNDFIQLSINPDGSFSIKDLASNIIYHQMDQLYSSLDAGDSYNYSKPENDMKSYAKLKGEVKIISTDFLKKMTYQLSLVQPKGLLADRKSPIKDFVETIIDCSVTLYQNSPMVYLNKVIHQKGKDQRLRTVFPMKSLIPLSYADSAYEIAENICNKTEIFVASRQKEVPVVVNHSLSMIHLDDEAHAFLFTHRGLHEYQTVESSQKTNLEVTLIRSVSHLSRDDFGSRGGAAGPNLATPEAQVERSVEINYAFSLSNAIKNPVESLIQSFSFRYPPVMLKGCQKMFEKSLISISNKHVILTSTRRVQKNTIEIRLWNPQSINQTTMINSTFEIHSILEVLMNRKEVGFTNNKIELLPHQIKTFIIKYEKNPF